MNHLKIENTQHAYKNHKRDTNHEKERRKYTRYLDSFKLY